MEKNTSCILNTENLHHLWRSGKPTWSTVFHVLPFNYENYDYLNLLGDQQIYKSDCRKSSTCSFCCCCVTTGLLLIFLIVEDNLLLKTFSEAHKVQVLLFLFHCLNCRNQLWRVQRGRDVSNTELH